jgi:hypothetical protein
MEGPLNVTSFTPSSNYRTAALTDRSAVSTLRLTLTPAGQAELRKPSARKRTETDVLLHSSDEITVRRVSSKCAAKSTLSRRLYNTDVDLLLAGVVKPRRSASAAASPRCFKSRLGFDCHTILRSMTMSFSHEPPFSQSGRAV